MRHCESDAHPCHLCFPISTVHGQSHCRVLPTRWRRAHSPVCTIPKVCHHRFGTCSAGAKMRHNVTQPICRPREIWQVLLRRGELVGEANDLSRIGSASTQQDCMRTNDKSCFATTANPKTWAKGSQVKYVRGVASTTIHPGSSTIMHAVHTYIRLHFGMIMRHLARVPCDMTLH